MSFRKIEASTHRPRLLDAGLSRLLGLCTALSSVVAERSSSMGTLYTAPGTSVV